MKLKTKEDWQIHQIKIAKILKIIMKSIEIIKTEINFLLVAWIWAIKKKPIIINQLINFI